MPMDFIFSPVSNGIFVVWPSRRSKISGGRRGANHAGRFGEERGRSPETVSYTHLDVYKRQGLDRAAAEVWSGCEMLLVRLRLQGRTELDGLLRKGTTCAELADRLREDGSGVPRIWIKDIDVATRPCVERGALLEREDLLGEVFRLSEAARTASGLQALREGPLAPLFAHARAGKALEPLTDEELARLLDDAESLCLDLLEND